MPKTVKLCFIRWLFVVALSSHLCNVSVGSPVKAHATSDDINIENCVSYSRVLLWTMTDALEQVHLQDNLFRGINCTEQSLEMNTKTQTASACEPNPRQDLACPSQRNTRFDKEECLRNIREDLQFYRGTLQGYSDQAPGFTLVKTIDDVMEHCFPSSDPMHSSKTEVSPGTGNTFEERLNLCKALKGFRVRAITINRAMSYIAAGDYMIENLG